MFLHSALYPFSLAEDLNLENEENGNHPMEGETSNDEHVAIVELDQKFKVLGDFTMLTTKVSKWNIILYRRRL